MRRQEEQKKETNVIRHDEFIKKHSREEKMYTKRCLIYIQSGTRVQVTDEGLNLDIHQEEKQRRKKINEMEMENVEQKKYLGTIFFVLSVNERTNVFRPLINNSQAGKLQTEKLHYKQIFNYHSESHVANKNLLWLRLRIKIEDGDTFAPVNGLS